jgi:hypothetical protein
VDDVALMDRETAAAVLGVRPDARLDRLAKAHRAKVKATHPDRFPPGSEAWEDANHELARVNEALWVLAGPPSERREPTDRAGEPAPGSPYDDVPSWERSSEGFRSPRDSDRLARAWGYGWGGFLLLSAVVSAVIGSMTAANDALPIWSPGLALIGGIAVAIGWRADRRLRR